VAERVDAAAVNFRHRPGGAELEIAGDQRDADGIARTKRLVASRCRRALLSAGACHHRQKTLLAERGQQRIDHRGIEAANGQRRRNRPQHRADARVEPIAEHLHVIRTLGKRTNP
jgi:hypothetical protein